MIVLGLDPGFRRFGWAVVRLGSQGDELLGMGVWRTAKTAAKANLRKASDDHRRGQELARELIGALDRWEPTVLCAEAISFVRSASVMASMGRVWGLLDVVCAQRELPLLEASPQALKKAVTGRLDASKADVQAALDARFGGRVSELLAGIRARTDHEHPVDALGAVVACLESDVIRMARRMSAA